MARPSPYLRRSRQVMAMRSLAWRILSDSPVAILERALLDHWGAHDSEGVRSCPRLHSRYCFDIAGEQGQELL